MNRLKIITADGTRAILRIRQRPLQYRMHGTWLRSPAESKLYALRAGFTLAGKRQR